MYRSPQTIENELEKELADIFVATTSYITAPNFQIAGLIRKIEKLANADAAAASSMWITLATLFGDREKGEYWARNAEKNRASKVEVANGLATLYINLGYFSESVPYLAFVANPLNGVAGWFFERPMANGAFHMLNDMYQKAVEMKIENLPEKNPFIPHAVEVMDYWGDTDADYTAVLDIAGSIMRERKLLQTPDRGFQTGINEPADGGPSTVVVTLRVDVDFGTALDMTLEYVDRLATSKVKIPQSLMFQFVSGVDE